MTKPKTKPAPAPEPAPKSRRLEVIAKPGTTPDRMLADLVAEGQATNASTALRFVYADHGELSLTDMVKALHAHGEAINRGDLSAAERMLNSQAVALNAMFGELARRAALNMGEYLDASERYMRLALKAQGQCRATLETLATIKNPPVVFARQANINNGGQQQVNNGADPTHAANSPKARASAHPGETAFGPNELLEDCTHGRTQLDTRATAAAGRTSQSLEPVGAFDRAANR